MKWRPNSNNKIACLLESLTFVGLSHVVSEMFPGIALTFAGLGFFQVVFREKGYNWSTHFSLCFSLLTSQWQLPIRLSAETCNIGEAAARCERPFLWQHLAVLAQPVLSKD